MTRNGQWPSVLGGWGQPEPGHQVNEKVGKTTSTRDFRKKRHTQTTHDFIEQ